jgi:hypothetical protein
MYDQVLAKIAGAFKQAKIPYLVIGGQAAILYGEPRLTKDGDFVVALATHEFKRVCDALSGIRLTFPPGRLAEFVKENMVLPAIHGESGLRLDFIFSVAPFEQAAIARANVVQVEGAPVNFAALNDMIIFKIISGRARDLEDIKGMVQRNHKAVNPHHVLEWLRLFEKESGEPFTAVFERLCEELKLPLAGA